MDCADARSVAVALTVAILPGGASQSFAFNYPSFAAMNARISSDMASNFSHCS
jgi:hypothetical protein